MNLSSVYARRLMWLGCLFSVIGLMSYAIYAERVLYLDPCPLCITQRLFYILIGLLALIGLLTVPRRGVQRVLAALMAMCAVGGIITAGRQVWLQHLPPEKVPECGPGLSYWMENEPWLQTLSLLFKGDGNCAEVHWRFMGFSMGEWSLAWFVGLLVIALVLFVTSRLNRVAVSEQAASQ
ncbi:disulfide bond formation protein B [Granulosicoccus sp. 3-233]|uniref:disulfide bond formation protein B n=1 Tax=Granulosicoccus sp. 3-233 TaxID=3417969 RepID=UPI003D328F61